MLASLPASQPSPVLLLVFFRSGRRPAHYCCHRLTKKGGPGRRASCSPFFLQGMPGPSWFLVRWALSRGSRKKWVWVWTHLSAQLPKSIQCEPGRSLRVHGANNVYTLHSLQSSLYLLSNQGSRSESGWEPHEAERFVLSHVHSHVFPRASGCRAWSLASSSPKPRSISQRTAPFWLVC